MKIGLNNIEIFQVFFDVVMEYQETVELFANETGIKISLLDRSRSCFYEVLYEKDFFDLFEVNGNEVISLYIEDLYNILKSSTKSDYMELTSDDDFVVVTFENERNRRVFELVQTHDYGETPPMPSIDLECSFITEMDVLERTFKDTGIINSQSLNMVVNDDELILATPSESQTRYSNNISVASKGVAKSKYSVRYLNDLVKFKKISPQLSAELGDNMPLLWSCETNGVTVRGLIAPLLEVE